MSRVTEGSQNRSETSGANAPSGTPAPAAAPGTTGVRDSLVGKIVCPFCGQQKSTSAEPCPRCTMEDTPATRQATKARIGPWYVLQNRSPSAPGMKYATLLWLVNKGHVTPRSVVRGPTTYQLWRYAAHVRGLSREFGLCYSCGSAVQKSDHACAQCERPQDPPVDPDVLLDVRDGVAGAVRAPVMREIDPRDAREARDVRDARAVAEARRTPPPMAPAPPPPVAPEPVGPAVEAERDAEDVEADEEVEDFAAAAAADVEPSHGDRLRAVNETIVRPKPHQDLVRRAGGRMVSSSHLAAALQDPDDGADAPRTRRWSALNVILFLLLLLGGAAAAVLYVKPEYREPAARWARQTWTSVRDNVASMQWSSPPGEPPAPRVASRPVAQSQTKTPVQPQPTQPPQTQPAHLVVSPPEREAQAHPRTQAQATTQPTTTPVRVARNDPPKVEPKVEPKEEPKSSSPSRQPQLARDTTAPPTGNSPEPKDQPQTQRKPDDRTASAQPSESSDNRVKQQQQQQQQHQPPPAPTGIEPVSLEQAMDESRKLRNQGIDAEARNDYAAALRFYEQIKKLRRDAWPSDLQVRIDLAREEIKARSAKSE